MAGQRALGIGGSTGAIPVLRTILQQIPADFAAPIFVVVHVGGRGQDLLHNSLAAACTLPVLLAQDNVLALPGHVYVAPADHHLLVVDGCIRLGRGPRENMSRPALDPLFRSMASSYGSGAIGVVLSGNLNDGAAGLSAIKLCGGLTVIQNPGEAVAPDMPLGALAASDIDYRSPAANMGLLLARLVEEPPGPSVPTPPDIELEIDIALGRPCLSPTIAQIANPVTVSCPSCGGVMSEVHRGPLRFRCQVGHGYTAEALAAEQEGSLDEALRVAFRIVGERVTLMERMAQEAGDAGRTHTRDDFLGKAAEFTRYVDILRSAALNGVSGRA
ncbi:chemotaxis protein CheB [Falsirhodobacter sp. 20TX0035]|uniref:chemotaxis protein CheB n=1 Tax=Falsirhodobacter sp. 20TX0035 TaxID=3022019 RepID=UPI00232EA0F8|nr:chemotaxis protein CheB [Falsirhodobacter sp. 20TX0035]MDB6453349.1 chemotaxis protein CheB [Falsirhodobacter sp. 20TX0035]